MPLDDKKILDVGSAGGFFLRSLLKYGITSSNLLGVDIWEDRLIDGHRRLSSLKLICTDGAALPFPDNYFDMVLQTGMLSSIIHHKLRHRIGREMLRVLKPGG